MSERFKMIASGYLILIKNGKVLLSRRFQTGYEDGNYSLPAGHIENNETITDGMCREVKEEIGVNLTSKDLQLAHVMHRKHFDIRVDYFFTTSKKGLKPKNLEPEKCDDLRWFPINTLPTNTIPYIRTAIENVRKGVFYGEFGWNKNP